jgi:hypothetical protein
VEAVSNSGNDAAKMNVYSRILSDRMSRRREQKTEGIKQRPEAGAIKKAGG